MGEAMVRFDFAPSCGISVRRPVWVPGQPVYQGVSQRGLFRLAGLAGIIKARKMKC